MEQREQQEPQEQQQQQQQRQQQQRKKQQKHLLGVTAIAFIADYYITCIISHHALQSYCDDDSDHEDYVDVDNDRDDDYY